MCIKLEYFSAYIFKYICVICIYIQREREREQVRVKVKREESKEGHIDAQKKVIVKSNEFPNYSYVSVAACLKIL